MKSFTRNRYENILCESLTEEIFMQKMMKLTEENPYFIKAALELIWLAEKNLNFILCNSILKKTLLRINVIYGNQDVRSHLQKEYSKEDIEDIEQVFSLLKKPWVKISFLSRGVVFLQRKIIKNFLSFRLNRSPKKNEYLKLIGKINMSFYVKELNNFLSKALAGENILLDQNMTDRFLNEIRAKLNGEKILDLRIKSSLITLNPQSQLYRNCVISKNDSIFYCIALNDKSSIFLESGRNSHHVHCGEIWLFNHKVMHKIENRSHEKAFIMLVEIK